MGMFGKHLLRITCDNGEVGYFMDLYDGYINLTHSAEAAERFLTKSGAKGFADSMDWSMPAYGKQGASRIVSVDLVTLG